MKRLEFHISYTCNHDCIFCSEYDRLVRFKRNPISLFQIKTILIDRRKKGFDHVNFTGGEPTLLPGFLNLLQFAKKLGYTTYVGTNGTMFAGRAFSQEALPYIDELSLSIHWYDDITAREQTGSIKHFSIFQDYISKNISKYQSGNFFFANIVINKKNYKNTIDIVKFIKESDYPVRQVLISVVAPEGLADHNFSDLVFDLKDFKEDIPEIIRYCDTQNIILRFFGLPNCILGEKYLDYANDLHWEERHTIERFTNASGTVGLVDIYSPDNSRKRTFVEKCDTCHWRNSPCSGVFSKYLESYNI